MLNLKTLPKNPGVYQMFDAASQLLYVGKAKNLKKRVSSYFKPDGSGHFWIKKVERIDCIVTDTEADAFLLESNLIKTHRPRYNILLRDDKSYPYIAVDLTQDFPRVDLYRGAQKTGVRYFGPYPNASLARDSLHLIQKLFLLRQCSNGFFKSRTRPCLQYQIERCSAPCVSFIDKTHYRNAIHHAILFLEGKQDEVTPWLQKQMDQASDKQNYERAAFYRDQIRLLQQIRRPQNVTHIGKPIDVDVVAMANAQDKMCFVILHVRSGQWIGQCHFFCVADEEAQHSFDTFLGQYYLSSPRTTWPSQLVLTHKTASLSAFETALEKKSGRHIKCQTTVRGQLHRLQHLALENAKVLLKSHTALQSSMEERLMALQEALSLPEAVHRMECFDISHFQGESPVASCVVFEEGTPLSSAYRRFNLEGLPPNDDYAAIYHAVFRRYERVKTTSEQELPELIIIDGGKGQFNAAKKALEALQLTDITLISISKGAKRRRGEETVFLSGKSLHLSPDSGAFHLIQHIRDEAHRFAITGHRHKRGVKRRQSVLESIPGVGVKRRQALLRYFGGLQEMKVATLSQLKQAPGIHHALAEKIYGALHEKDQ